MVLKTLFVAQLGGPKPVSTMGRFINEPCVYLLMRKLNFVFVGVKGAFSALYLELQHWDGLMDTKMQHGVPSQWAMA